MKKFFLSTLVSMLVSMSTYADVKVPAWVCNLAFRGHAQGLEVIVGKFDVKALGELKCVSPFQDVKTIPVKIDMSTKIAPRIALGKFDIYGQSAQLGLFAHEPEELLGTYYVAQGQGTLVAGAGAMTAIHTSIPNLAMNVSVQFVKGFGLNLGITKMKIEEAY